VVRPFRQQVAPPRAGGHGSITVAIDGEIYAPTDFQPMRDGCEIYRRPKIEAGY
jgi:hypothetical protein